MDREILLFLFILQPIRDSRAILGGFTSHGLQIPALLWSKQAMIHQTRDSVMPLTHHANHHLETVLKAAGSQLKTFH